MNHSCSPFPTIVRSLFLGATVLAGGVLQMQAQVVFVPGEVSGYANFMSPQATVNAAGRSIGTQVYNTSQTRVISWIDGASTVTLPSGGFTNYATVRISQPGPIFGFGTTGNQTRPLRWDSVTGAPTVLGTLAAHSVSGAIDSRVTAVTPAGLAVGYSDIYEDEASLGRRALVWPVLSSTPTVLPLASEKGDAGSAQATAVSPGGVVAGQGTLYVGGVAKGSQGIRWQKDSGGTVVTTALNPTSLDAVNSGSVDIKAVNDLGTVAGNSRKYSATGVDLGLRAVRWDAGSSTPTELGILGTLASGANVDTTVIAIDRFGNIAGLSQKYVSGASRGTRPVVWKAGTTAPLELPMYDLDPVNTRGNMSAMNSAGYIAGTMQSLGSTVPTGRKATIWHIDGAIYNLNDYLPAGYTDWVLTNCTDIDDSGWISGYASWDVDGAGPGTTTVERYFSMHVPAFAAKTPASSSNLAISKIMYLPLPGTSTEVTAGFASADAFEYLEFVNTGATTIDLMGLRLDGPVQFNFTTSLISRYLAPGARVLVASNKAAFDFRYGAGKPVAGTYTGTLPDTGGHVTLYSPSNTIVAEVTYGGTSAPTWPTEPAVAGHSLVRRFPTGSTAENNDPTSWRASVVVGGAPGASDALTYAGWKTANGASGAGDTDDSDFDGLNTFQEYAQAGTLTAADPQRAPVISTASFTVESVTSTYAVITYSRRFAADDVAYTVQTSPSLQSGSWTSSGAAVFVSATRQGDGSETVVYRAATPIPPAGAGGSGSGQFYRVQMQSR